MSKYIGNTCLLVAYRISNLGIILVALGLIALGIYLSIKTHLVNFFVLFFVCFGALIFFLSVYGFFVKQSHQALKCYFGLMTTLLITQLLITVLCYCFSADLIKWAGEHFSSNAETAKEFETLIEDNMTLSLIISVSFASVQTLFLFFMICYKASLKKANQFNERIKDEIVDNLNGSYLTDMSNRSKLLPSTSSSRRKPTL